MRLLLVDDDPAMRGVLRNAFAKERFLVDTVDDCRRAAAQASSQDYDLIVFGLDPPRCDGLEVCRRIRDAHVDAPILIVAGTGAPEDCSPVLDAGADDCVRQPFELGEMMARARALLRRGRTRHLSATMEYGPLRLDPQGQVVTLMGVPLDLSATEYRLLRFFMRHAETIVTRDQLIQHVWAGRLDRRSNTPDVYLSYLRQKLAPAGLPLIHTVRRHGFVLKIGSRADSHGESARAPRS